MKVGSLFNAPPSSDWGNSDGLGKHDGFGILDMIRGGGAMSFRRRGEGCWNSGLQVRT